MSIQSEIKEALEQRILEGLQADEPATQLLAVARQFLKDFPPEGANDGPGPKGMLAKYAKQIDKLEDAGVTESSST